VSPVINHYTERAEFPRTLVEKLAKLGVVRDDIDGCGCPPIPAHLQGHRGH
jgi:glutaryl-CoA dehydrogenase